MRNLDLSAYGVEAMPKQEMKTTDGGLDPVTISILIGGAFWLLSEFDSIKKGAKDAMNDREYDYDNCTCR